MNKILVIGQAPPAVKQGVPYDTTMLYDWLAEVGITKTQAQDLFEWEAVSNIFPGHGKKGHLIPTLISMEDHWVNTLEKKVLGAEKVWVLGKVAEDFLKDRLDGKNVLHTMHPSKRNAGWYLANKWQTLMLIEGFLNDLI